MIRLFTIVFLLFFSAQLTGQILTNRIYSSVEVPRNSTFMILVDSVYINNLVLHDGSELKFGHDVSYIFIGNAIVGKDCTLNAAGDDGASGQHGKQEKLKQGQDGKPGKSVTVVINFQELSSLNILASGGQGGNGGHSRTSNWQLLGVPSSYGRDGGNGGDGGDGGRIELFYHVKGFVPTFNRPSKHSIHLTVDAGEGGDFGFKDRWALFGAIHGGLGGNGKQGGIVIKKIQDWSL